MNMDPDKYHILVAFLTVLFLIAGGTTIFHILEGWSIATSFYFSIVTLFTIGYGDLHPTTELSRVITAFYILFGVGTTLTAITVIATDRINKLANTMRNRSDTGKNDSTENS